MMDDHELDRWFGDQFGHKHAEWYDKMIEVENWPEAFGDNSLYVEDWIACAIQATWTGVGTNFNCLSDAVTNLVDYAEGSKEMESMFGEDLLRVFNEHNKYMDDYDEHVSADVLAKKLIKRERDYLFSHVKKILKIYKEKIQSFYNYDFEYNFKEVHEEFFTVKVDGRVVPFKVEQYGINIQMPDLD
tara:strand:- start:1722 stop:2282 length:561 start_codon:yes stop_codon:yes gene_type:complete